jgi:hypothetical protein
LLLFTVCGIFLSSLTLCTLFSRDRSNWYPFFFQHYVFRTFQVFLIYFPNCPSFSTIETILQMYHFTSFSLNSKFNCWRKESSSCWMLFLPRQSWIEYHAYILHHLLSQIVGTSTVCSCSWSIVICIGDGCLKTQSNQSF